MPLERNGLWFACGAERSYLEYDDSWFQMDRGILRGYYKYNRQTDHSQELIDKGPSIIHNFHDCAIESAKTIKNHAATFFGATFFCGGDASFFAKTFSTR